MGFSFKTDVVLPARAAAFAWEGERNPAMGPVTGRTQDRKSGSPAQKIQVALKS
ncbi:hypothetical protein J2T09_000268 [Neorhizobium huautlense]|uniref:Uncharacterized protein n=1 Tax=Neorhizobium huautlense TaxID=67774 RepID=A0ABT9PM36_9HYPH|nr:hypothetical protein [Neorhizobium huautlense]